jgi:prolyl-tRNA editing enzyme YbaK/EbsC (Cys-tRNA(Pro) deacylase)
MTALPPSSQKVQAALLQGGINVQVIELPSSTRTAYEAATSLGCDIAEILKSLLFLGRASHQPWLVLATGESRIDEAALGSLTGEPMRLAKASEVRDLTGFAIGGVPPVGHATAFPTLIESGVERRTAVWAAAGTPHTVFQISSQDLIRITGGLVAAFASKEGVKD